MGACACVCTAHRCRCHFINVRQSFSLFLLNSPAYPRAPSRNIPTLSILSFRSPCQNTYIRPPPGVIPFCHHSPRERQFQLIFIVKFQRTIPKGVKDWWKSAAVTWCGRSFVITVKSGKSRLLLHVKGPKLTPEQGGHTVISSLSHLGWRWRHYCVACLKGMRGGGGTGKEGTMKDDFQVWSVMV